MAASAVTLLRQLCQWDDCVVLLENIEPAFSDLD